MPNQPHPLMSTSLRQRRRAIPDTTLVRAALALAVLAGGLSACSSPPSPTAEAQAFATALGKKDLSGIHLTGATTAEATKETTEVLDGMGAKSRTVTLVSAVVNPDDGQKALATLRTTWQVGDGASGTWTYETKAPMTLADDQWSLAWSRAVLAPDLTRDEVLRISSTPAARGNVTGAKGRTIVEPRDVFHVGIDKSRVKSAQLAASAKALAAVVEVDPADYAKAVAAGGPQQFVIAVTYRATDPMLAVVDKQITSIPGGVRVPDTIPLPPTRTFARELLGTVGPATAEIVAQSKGAVTADMTVGLSGLQKRYDEQLRGTPGRSVEAAGTAEGGQKTARTLFTVDPVDGTALELTLDIEAQEAAEQALATVRNPAALVAIRASTGEIVAAANGPGNGGQNTATLGQVAPGSTFKIVSSLAALRAGLKPSAALPCTSSIVVDGRRFENYDDYPSGSIGTIPMTTALANSCNTAFISLHDKVSQADLVAAAESLGFGVDLDLGFPSFLGAIPTEATKTEHAASFIGQAKVQANPMDLATVVASVIAGKTVRPVLVPEWPTSHPLPAVALTAAEAKDLRTMMSAVVTQGSGRRLAPVGVTMAKTGTAEYGDAAKPKRYTWMVAGKGDLAIAVWVQDGVTGASTAGPVISDFLTRWSPTS